MPESGPRDSRIIVDPKYAAQAVVSDVDEARYAFSVFIGSLAWHDSRRGSNSRLARLDEFTLRAASTRRCGRGHIDCRGRRLSQCGQRKAERKQKGESQHVEFLERDNKTSLPKTVWELQTKGVKKDQPLS